MYLYPSPMMTMAMYGLMYENARTMWQSRVIKMERKQYITFLPVLSIRMPSAGDAGPESKYIKPGKTKPVQLILFEITSIKKCLK